ncbi:MAG TPA: type II toxin-antitoxin system VapC family toxin [Candidatus Methanoperedens sp.]
MTECIDASIIVKWFHKGEVLDAESHILLGQIIELEHDFVVNEWALLEVVRAMVKAGYTKQKVNDAFDEIFEMMNIGAIRKIPVSDVLHLAKSIELNYSLYAADAVHIATAIHTNASILWTEDHHMQKESLKELFRNHSIEVKSLERLTKY